jgi:hypothetical protein
VNKKTASAYASPLDTALLQLLNPHDSIGMFIVADGMSEVLIA